MPTTEAPARNRPREPGLAWLAGAYLLAVGAMFGAGYQLTLHRAERLWVLANGLPSSWLAADAWVPFWAPALVPYASINLAYPAAFFLCRDLRELQGLALRLMAVQALAFTAFWQWPLRLAHPRPELSGPWAEAYGWLGWFDRPYNLVPSLHVAALVVLWAAGCRRFGPRARPWLHAWALAVALSTLLSWQHHLLDVAAGAALGALASLSAGGRAAWRRRS